ncbi:unnamed protein product [Pleuronectes platessa]|uniref:Uncharacterized protein n=1 Tax=Pleuronectes platessa TaxID=8262 RepID=A0A9N7TP85_PLEPL|nr:unnamed protein product [Pleuronectes platessa]
MALLQEAEGGPAYLGYVAEQRRTESKYFRDAGKDQLVGGERKRVDGQESVVDDLAEAEEERGMNDERSLGPGCASASVSTPVIVPGPAPLPQPFPAPLHDYCTQFISS